ncbi:uncharacterized protein RSE6_06486 [Rhynchosporium secalis]|uniref:Uncharacterized protein n=1 Tax=Rhynchosporium secalis TaxID=38038 RepID=A0A1E1MAF1_RHYSE|nr:uncharacterized protein RSE6_06486 [Rhynchosporium secalis]
MSCPEQISFFRTHAVYYYPGTAGIRIRSARSTDVAEDGCLSPSQKYMPDSTYEFSNP